METSARIFKDLSGLTINLLVQDMKEATNFVKNILQARSYMMILILQPLKGLGLNGVFILTTHTTYILLRQLLKVQSTRD